jgi:hypothetical protein
LTINEDFILEASDLLRGTLFSQDLSPLNLVSVSKIILSREYLFILGTTLTNTSSQEKEEEYNDEEKQTLLFTDYLVQDG